MKKSKRVIELKQLVRDTEAQYKTQYEHYLMEVLQNQRQIAAANKDRKKRKSTFAKYMA